MHTFKGKECWIHHNSDLSGDIIINGKDDSGNEVSVIVPAEDILEFVARRYVAVNRISEIEDMEYKELLK